MQDVLDNDDHPLHKSSRRLGYSFGTIPRIGSGVFLVISLLMMLGIPILGIPLSLFFVFALTSSYGFQIDTAKQRFREYSKAFGIKRGEWKKLDDFPFVAILKSQKGHTAASMSNRTVTTTDEVFEVYLLSETHRTKVQVAEFRNLEKAKSFAKEFATVVEKQLVNYSPQITPSSKKRR
jgi:hypothetical protein